MAKHSDLTASNGFLLTLQCTHCNQVRFNAVAGIKARKPRDERDNGRACTSSHRNRKTHGGALGCMLGANGITHTVSINPGYEGKS